MADDRSKRVAVNTVAREMRNQADRDYISARHLYALGFADQFMWQAQQSLEKYLKSSILYKWPLPHEGGSLPSPMRGRKRKSDGRPGYGHDLLKLLDDLIGIQPWQPDVPKDVYKFIKHVHRMGLNRYGDQHVYRFGDELVNLDMAVWYIRRWCTYHSLVPSPKLPSTLTSQRWIELQRDMVIRLQPGDIQHSCGELEAILNLKRRYAMWTKQQARAALIRWNQWFFARRRSPYLPPRIGSSSVPVWGRHWAQTPEIKKLLQDIGVGQN